METFQSLLSGRIPTNPLWAELYAERKRDQAAASAGKRRESSALKNAPRRASRNVSTTVNQR